MPSCGAETHLFFSHLAIDASDTSASRTWGPCRPASPIAPSEASYEGRNELEECLDNDGRSVASTVCVTKRHKTPYILLFTTLAIVTTVRDPRFTKQCRLLQRGGLLAAHDARTPDHLYATMIHLQQRTQSPFQSLCQQVHCSATATNEKNFGDEENSLTSKNSRILAHTHHHCYKHI